MVELGILPYPLNIYSTLLLKETGAVIYPHYDQFELMDESIDTVCNKIIKIITSQFPDKGKILEIGCGFGHLTEMLRNSGFEITGITTAPAQIVVAKAKYGNELPVKCLNFEYFCEGEGTWDLIIFHESSQQFPMLDLFNKASKLLKKDGQIIALDEFSCKRTESGLEKLHHKGYFLTLAQRFGFACLNDIDCTLAAQPMLDLVVCSLEEYRESLAFETDTSLYILNDLLKVNCTHREKYRSGRFGYFLIHLQRQHIPRWRLSQLTEQDHPAVSALFEKAFAHSFSLDMWRWKYGVGRGHAIGLWENDTLIAHYGGIPRQLSVAGVNIMTSQSCDAMVSPHVRGTFVRKGPFFQVCATYVEQFVGYGTDYTLSFGFASERSFRLPKKLGIYTDPITKIYEYSWSATTFKSNIWAIRLIDPSKSKDATIVDALWQQMVCELDPLVVGVRDSAYLSARFQKHPQYAYGLYLVYHRWLRKPLAVVVIKKEGERLELLDWVAGVRNIPTVIIAVRSLAANYEAREAYLLASLPVEHYIVATSPEVKDAHITVPSNAWTCAPDKEILQDKLWLTGGDTDYH